MDSIIRAADGREFPAGQERRAADYEALRLRLASLTGLDADGHAPRPVAMLCLDPFHESPVDLAQRIEWAQEMVRAWEGVLDWQLAELGDQERAEYEGQAVPMLESWKWQDERIDGSCGTGPVTVTEFTAAEDTDEELDEAGLRLRVRQYTREMPAREAVVDPDPDGVAARASGQPIWFRPGSVSDRLEKQEVNPLKIRHLGVEDRPRYIHRRSPMEGFLLEWTRSCPVSTGEILQGPLQDQFGKQIIHVRGLLKVESTTHKSSNDEAGVISSAVVVPEESFEVSPTAA